MIVHSMSVRSFGLTDVNVKGITGLNMDLLVILIMLTSQFVVISCLCDHLKKNEGVS